MRNPWLPFGTGSGRLRLFIFPNAGGAASMFRAWRGQLGPEVDVCPVLLPGRESRLREPPFRRMDRLVEALSSGLRSAMDRPFCFAGHSMGAAVAFELAHRLRHEGRPAPATLLLMGRQAPHLPSLRPPTNAKPDDRFLEQLRELGGTPREVLESAELMAILLPMLRADFELIETYRPANDREPLDRAFHVYGGDKDEDTPRDRLEAWREVTTGATRVTVVAGGHFFLHQDNDHFLDVVRRDLEPSVP